MSVTRGECKTPGGKLVAVNVDVDGDQPYTMSENAGNQSSTRCVRSCRLDGDFFIEGDDMTAQRMIADIEHALLAGRPVRDAIGRYDSLVRLVGTDSTAIETAYARALAQAGIDRRNPKRNDYDGQALFAETDQDHAVHGIRESAGRIADGRRDEDWMAGRWDRLHPIIVHDTPREPAAQMTLDEQWAREVASGRRAATIRFWEWASSAVVVGRYQSIPDEVHEDVAQREGFSIVRRCTGGGAMFIEPGNTITYSLYAPLAFVEGISVEESYRLCDRWLIDVLGGIGIAATFGGINDIVSHDLVTGRIGGKIGGAAQRRFPARQTGPGSVLHHVTLAYDIDAERMARVLNTSAEKMSDKAVRSARKRVDPLRSQTGMTRDEIVSCMIGHLRSQYAD